MPAKPSIHKEFNEFLLQLKTLMLATTNAKGEPESSYAPFVKRDNCYFIYVSELASHTSNLLEQGKASVMFIESEETASNLFARRRATLPVTVEPIERNSPLWEEVMATMEETFGETIQMIKPLTDFHLLALTPQSATYVKGFGKAFVLEGEELSEITHLKGK